MVSEFQLDLDAPSSELLATYRCAELQVELAHRVPVIHGVEGRHLVHTHWRHVQQPCNLVHNAQTCESKLTLSEIQDGHHSGLLVLWGVALQDLLDELVILVVERKRDVGIILRGVTMLNHVVRICPRGGREL